MINKTLKVVALALAGLAMTACGSNGGGSESKGGYDNIDYSTPGSYTPAKATGSDDLTYVCPTGDTEYMKEAVTAFKAANPDYSGNITLLTTQGEGDVSGDVIKDPSAAADVILVADNNVRDLVDARCLVEWTSEEMQYYGYHNGGYTAMSSGEIGGKGYALPYRGDNGYQLIYDKSVIPASETTSMEKLLAAAKSAGVTVGMDLGGGWYIASWFFTNGVKMEYDAEDKFVCDIAGAAGLEAMKTVNKLWLEYGGTTWISTDAASGFGAGQAVRKGAQVIWNAYDSIKDVIGDNIGVAQLPTATFGSTAKSLYTYSGYKDIAVIKKSGNSASKTATAKLLALFLGSTEQQKKRLVDLNQGVTDVDVVAETSLWQSPFLNSLAAQQAAGNSVVQATHAIGTWWDAATALMANIVNQKADNPLTEAGMQEALNTAQAAILAE